jgi:hypothetical protein
MTDTKVKAHASLSYKDAVELRDAGFPIQSGEDGRQWLNNGLDVRSDEYEEIYAPTLEELVEECTRDVPFSIFCGSGKGKYAVEYRNDEGYEYFEGSSPSQAVKNLYCSLRGK